MPIWKLTPTSKESDHWRGSSYKGKVIVRAATEEAARARAASEYTVAGKKAAGSEAVTSSWDQLACVICQRLIDSDYEDTGPDQVLFRDS